MNKLAAVLAAGLGLLAACGQDYGAEEVVSRYHSHIPPVAHEAAQGAPVNGDTEMVLSVALPLRNEEALDATLAALYDPNSPQFGQFLTPKEFALRHHPSAEEVAQVRAALIERGLVPQERAHGCLLLVHGRAADVEEAFSTALYHFTGHDGSHFVAPTAEPSAPGGIRLSAVHGLVSGFRPRAFYHRSDWQPHEATRDRAHAFAQATNTLTASLLRGAYRVPEAARGEGQTIGLFQLDSYDPVDVAQYANVNHLPQPTLTAIRLDGAQKEVVDGNTQVEVQLDIMMAMAMAPNAEIRLYQGQSAGGSAGYQYYLNVFNEMANPTLGDQKLVRNLSTSYGYFEAQLSSATLQSEAVIFKQFAAQGQSLFSAAGDSGALGYNSSGQEVVTVVDPAVQPYVVAVGGTRLGFEADGTYVGEAAWAQGGGGVSRLWPRPHFQREVPTTGTVSASLRNAPDVAINADPNSGFQIVFNRRLMVVGGTSAAAPLWASVQALLNERRGAQGTGDVGFFNEALYRLGMHGSPAAALHDVTKGDNGRYVAAPGYDNATGWGSPRVDGLLRALAGSYGRRAFSAAP